MNPSTAASVTHSFIFISIKPSKSVWLVHRCSVPYEIASRPDYPNGKSRTMLMKTWIFQLEAVVTSWVPFANNRNGADLNWNWFCECLEWRKYPNWLTPSCKTEQILLWEILLRDLNNHQLHTFNQNITSWNFKISGSSRSMWTTETAWSKSTVRSSSPATLLRFKTSNIWKVHLIRCGLLSRFL